MNRPANPFRDEHRRLRSEGDAAAGRGDYALSRQLWDQAAQLKQEGTAEVDEVMIRRSYLTEPEHQAIAVAGDLFTLLEGIVGHGPTREADLGELRAAIHVVQHAVMAQSTARAYPSLYRTLGGEIGTAGVDP